jgi:hypothetical protein
MQISPSAATFLSLTWWTEAFTFLATLLAFGSSDWPKTGKYSKKRRQFKILKLKINCNKLSEVLQNNRDNSRNLKFDKNRCSLKKISHNSYFIYNQNHLN